MILQQEKTIDAQIEEYTVMLQGLAHPVRLAVIENLMERERTSVSTICWLLGISEATALRHLTRLQEANVIELTTDRHHTYYTVTNEKVKSLVRIMAQ